MYLWTCAPSEDSDQHAHSRSLIRFIICHISDNQECKDLIHADNEDSDQPARMPKGTFSNVAAYLVLVKTDLCIHLN